MEVQLGLTAVDGGIEGAFKEVMSAERKAFITPLALQKSWGEH